MERLRNPQTLGLVVAGFASLTFVSAFFLQKTNKKINELSQISGFYNQTPAELQNDEWAERLQVASNVALLAAEAIKNGMDGLNSVDFKGDIDLVTDTDRANEKLIFETLRKYFPNDKFIGEESSSDNGKIEDLTEDPTWIVDPVDGTTNFVHGFPASVVSIGLAVGKELTLGVVVDPSKNEVFQVIKGKGAFLNGVRQKCSGETEMKNAMVIQEFGYERTDEGIQKMLKASELLLKEGVRALRQIGSGALDLVYVGCGRADAVYTGLAGESWKPWDYAAGGLFATECGCIMSTVDGRPFDVFQDSMVCASSSLMLMEIVSICGQCLHQVSPSTKKKK